MRVIKSYYVIEDKIDGMEILKKIEKAGRTCYKSEDKITNESALEFVKKIIKRGHESVLEHEKITVRIICDRGVSHEIVRHRIASYSQESTRYCDYSNGHITFIIPLWIKGINENTYKEPLEMNAQYPSESKWFNTMLKLEAVYHDLRNIGWKPEQARSVLPNSLKTEIVCTFNLREWRHVFNLRCSVKAHPQMQEIMLPLLKEFNEKIPVIFEDILNEET